MAETHAQTPRTRVVIDALDQEFARLHLQLRSLIEATPEADLYTPESASVGENVLRSAAAIERTFGGITANLWDDPFEWTLPEHLSTRAKVIEHLNEVEALRAGAFESFLDDSVLPRHIATPAQETESLIELLERTLAESAEFAERAFERRKLDQ